MINNLQEKIHAENRIRKLESIIASLKDELLPEREEQFKVMSKVYVKKIIELREEIEAYIGMDLILVERKDINIHIKGPTIDYGSAPISVISAYLENFRKTIQRIYGIVNDVDIKTRVPSFISKLTDFRLVSYVPGSINFSLSFPDRQLNMFDDISIDTSIEMYFDILKWISGDMESSKKIEMINEEKLEKLLINVLKTLPDDKNISSIEFFGGNIDKKIYINNRSKDVIINAIKRIESEEKLLKYKGCIRELDLDKLTFLLRNIDDSGIKQLKCQITEENIDDIKTYFDSDVIVTGVKRGNLFYIKYIEAIE